MRKWTDADRKRGEKMGWRLYKCADGNCQILRHDATFKSQREAVEWVNAGRNVAQEKADRDTCTKAIMLCCLGGEQ